MDEKILNQKTDDARAVPAVGIMNKEAGIRAETDRPEAYIPPEVKDYIKPAEPPVPEHADVEVKPSLESTPPQTQPSGTVQLPMTEERADTILKNSHSKFNLHENVGDKAGEYTEDSLPFYATVIKKVIEKMRGMFRRKN